MGLLDKFKSILKSDKLDIDARFELLRSAISGTMSNFYMARDRESGEVVGLKVAKKDKLEEFEQRFTNRGITKPPEGEIAIKFKHPNVVETVEYGETTTRLPYLIMEYLSGPGLHELIYNRDEVLEGRRVPMIRQMAKSLEYVHEQGYIHRDVCPRNFICSPDYQTLKLIDFGLTLPATDDFTQPGNRTGTPLYMAPEVVRRRKTDKRLDIFAFGVTCYHLCTFELPWPVNDLRGIAALSHDTMEPRPITDYRPRINRQLAKTIMDCMAPEPGKRLQTFGDVLWKIRDIDLENEST